MLNGYLYQPISYRQSVTGHEHKLSFILRNVPMNIQRALERNFPSILQPKLFY